MPTDMGGSIIVASSSSRHALPIAPSNVATWHTALLRVQ
jgi:hypothetical protein